MNKKFKDCNEVFKYAKKSIEYIRYMYKKNVDKGWMAQGMIEVSNMEKDVSLLRYENSGKSGRPIKRFEVDEIKDN